MLAMLILCSHYALKKTKHHFYLSVYLLFVVAPYFWETGVTV